MQQQTGTRFCFTCGFVAEGSELVCPKDGSRLSAMAADPYVGKTLLQKYEVLQLLGRGGMSIVYKVRHLFVNRLEALKMLRTELITDSDALLRFQQESKSVSTLRHINLVTVLDFGLLEDDTPYLTMEFLEGKDLGEVLKEEGAIAPERAIPVFAQICDGLFHAHSRGVIHRDIKPSNILITRDPNGLELPVVVDFGIAKLISADGSTMNKLTATGQVFGSPLYMSPEQCSSKRADERTDIYALGCVLYQTLTGVPPIQGSTPVETMMKQMQELPRAFSFAKPGHTISHKIEQVVLKTLAKEPEDRYRNMNEFRKALLQAANLPVTELAGANSTLDTVRSTSISGGGRSLSDSDQHQQIITADQSTETQLRKERERLGDQLALEVANQRLVSRPVFQIGIALIIICVIGICALVMIPTPHLDESEDGNVDPAIQRGSGAESKPHGRGPKYADRSLANLPRNLSRAKAMVAMAPSNSFVSSHLDAAPSTIGSIEAVSRNDTLEDSSDTKINLPDCRTNLTSDDWCVLDPDINQLQLIAPGKQLDHQGSVYRIVFPAKRKKVLQVMKQESDRLLSVHAITKVSEPLTVEANELPILCQVMTHKNKRKSYVYWYSSGGYVMALQVVPGRADEEDTEEFIQEKLLPSFQKN